MRRQWAVYIQAVVDIDDGSELGCLADQCCHVVTTSFSPGTILLIFPASACKETLVRNGNSGSVTVGMTVAVFLIFDVSFI